MKLNNVKNIPCPQKYKLYTENIQNLNQIKNVLLMRINDESSNNQKINTHFKIILNLVSENSIDFNLNDNINTLLTELDELVNQNNLDAIFIKSILQYIQYSSGNAFFDDISSLNDNLDHLINNG